MPRSDPSKARVRTRGWSSVERRGSNVAATRTRRPVQIHNGCRGLRFSRRAVAAVIHLLDAHASEILGQPPSTLDARRSPLGSRRSALRAPSSALSAPPSASAPRPSTPSGIPPGELSIAFLPETALTALHGRFLGDPSATDVITFAGDAGLGQAGEICVSPDAARSFAENRGGDSSAELTLYLVHGWLHLAGHDDLAPVRKRRMRAAEARAMSLIRRARAVPQFAFE